MNMDFARIGQASNLALVRACRRLEKGGCTGEAARAWSMADHWRDLGAKLITDNCEAIRKAPALKVVRQLSVLLARTILEVEVSTRKR